MKKIRAIWQTATTFEKLTLILSVAYMLFPLDFLPEAVFGPFGIFDDATALGVFVWTIRGVIKRIKENEDAARNATSVPSSPPSQRQPALEPKR
ncbi:MAG: DUF1232 domain-containing protein [Chloroherpetonaceae bacterium]|nr:DUF1232 domain-containing protein [Chloroherpetonaceae bacterium]MDW8437251.1 DUF1232 domain-containing protein [Chloroherpetonaceae bacterium]